MRVTDRPVETEFSISISLSISMVLLLCGYILATRALALMFRMWSVVASAKRSTLLVHVRVRDVYLVNAHE